MSIAVGGLVAVAGSIAAAEVGDEAPAGLAELETAVAAAADLHQA